jgi:dipeptide transport system substrate-binding protein
VPRDALSEPGRRQALKDNPDITVMEQEGLNVGYLAYNTTQAPFDNAKVRKALNMAINKQAILDAVFQGAGQAAKNPIPPTMWSYNDAIEDDPYDPEAAKAMLEEAGVSDLSMKVWAMPVQRPYNPNARRMAELIQEDFSKIGVDVEIVSYEWGEYLERSKARSTATARCCSAGPATMATRTTSSPCCSAATPSAAPTAPSGATRSSTT